MYGSWCKVNILFLTPSRAGTPLLLFNIGGTASLPPNTGGTASPPLRGESAVIRN